MSEETTAADQSGILDITVSHSPFPDRDLSEEEQIAYAHTLQREAEGGPVETHVEMPALDRLYAYSEDGGEEGARVGLKIVGHPGDVIRFFRPWPVGGLSDRSGNYRDLGDIVGEDFVPPEGYAAEKKTVKPGHFAVEVSMPKAMSNRSFYDRTNAEVDRMRAERKERKRLAEGSIEK